jgi:predicted O-methyltransferase YrrM
VYPCYPLINYRDKIQNSTNVCIIGGGNIHHNHNINVINRLQSNGRIKLNIFVRKECKTDISELEMNKFDINFIEDISTSKMIQILNQSSYVLVNYNNNEDHNNGISCSGSLQLALSTLCKPIIVNTANKYLQIKNALEYDIKSNEPIFIDKEINFRLLEEERNNYVDKFDKYIGNILSIVYLRILSDSGTSNNMEDWMQTDKLSYMYNKPVILTKKDDFTHCIIINSGMPHLNINKNKVVGICHEPILPPEPVFSQLIEYSKNNMSKYFIGDKNDLPEPFTEGPPFIFHNTTRYNNIKKTKFCSIVISGKQFMMGHKYRNKLVEAILKTDLPIDIYGYGVETYKQKMDDPRLKYSLENTLKNPFGTDPFIDYKFHICIENMVSNNYFSEKIVNPLLSNVIPIYYGCKKIDNYFDNIIKLSGNEEDDIQSLKYIYQNQNMYDNNIDSDKILDKCNIFYNLHTFFDDIKLKDEIIIPNKNIKQESNNKNLCLLTYGQLRTFKNNFRNNLLELYPVYTEYENVYIFILLDELSSNEEVARTVYKENCDYIENVCKEFNIKIGFIQDINNLNYKHEEINYCNKLLLQKSDDKKEFPNNFVLNLLYRKYKLIELVEEYCIDHKLDISTILHSRLFDVIIKKNISASTIRNNLKNADLRKTIYCSPDTIFFGNHNLIKKIMKFENIYNSDELWNNKDFCNFSYRFDSILTNNKHTYAPEIQYIANMYFQSIDGINLRYYKPDTNCVDKNLMYEVILDPNRNNSTIYEINNKLFNLNLTSEYILELNNSIDSNYLEYFNESGLNDYKQKIGNEHYKLLCAISSQICNGTIIDIGTHNGNSAIALGYNLYKNKNNILDRSMLYTFDITDLKSESFRKFMNNNCIHSSLENIFDYTIRDKYKNVLLESELIMIDIDPHNGLLEYELYSWLFENNYKGIILFDDIFLEKGHTANNYDATCQSMKIFWNKIPDKYKLDITHIGHWSGTGLVSFNNNNIIKLDSNNIPSKIFQTWEHANIEPEFQHIINKWKENNPNYEYIFHDAEQRLQFIQDNFKENVLNAYKKIIPGAYKCDLWRYCVLYIYGGFYADIDTLCMGKLNSLTNKNIEFIVPVDLNINPREGQHNLACGFIGSVPKSPILLDAIDRIVFNVENNIIPPSKLDFSGPGLLGRAVNKFLKLDETSSFKGKEGVRNNINFLEFDPNTEYMKDVYTDSIILQNKNRNSDIIRLYNNECNKIKNYTCWLSNNVINTDL